jgi:hypothetical protein
VDPVREGDHRARCRPGRYKVIMAGIVGATGATIAINIGRIAESPSKMRSRLVNRSQTRQAWVIVVKCDKYRQGTDPGRRQRRRDHDRVD